MTEQTEQSEPDYRFTLASERTFLAYERTAIALIAAGLAVFHLFELSWANKLLTGLLLAGGLVAAVGGYYRFHEVDKAIRAGDPLPANPSAHVLAVAVVVCVVASVLSVLFTG